MKVVYIAGPFRAMHAWGVEQNIRRAEMLALEVWIMGAAAICPHANTRYFDGVLDGGVFLDGDLEIVKRCDAVLMTHDWKFSVGATAEHALAIKHGLRVFYNTADLNRWLKNES